MKKAVLGLLIIIIIISACSCNGQHVGSQDMSRPLIYVKNLIQLKDVSAPEAQTISEEIEKAVIASGRYEVMSQSQVKELFNNAEKKQIFGCNAEECLRQIMKTTMTDYLLYGTISKDEGEYAISVNLMRQKEGETAVVDKTATKFTRSLSTKSLTNITKLLISTLHGEKVIDDSSKILKVPKLEGDLVYFIVNSTPPGGDLYISDIKKGSTPRRLLLPALTYKGKIEKFGYQTAEFDMNLQDKHDYNIYLKKEVYTLSIKADTGMTNEIDIFEGDSILGKVHKTGILLIIESGEHLLTLKSKDYEEKHIVVNISKSTSLTVKLNKIPLVMKKATIDDLSIVGSKKPLIYIKNLELTKEISAVEAQAVSSEIEKAVIASGRYEVMSQSQVKELFNNAEKKQIFGCNAEECLRQIMKTTMTDYLIVGKIINNEGLYSISVNLMRMTEDEVPMVVNNVVRTTDSLSTKSLMLLAKELIEVLHGEKKETKHGTEKEIGGMNFIYIKGGTFLMGSPKDWDLGTERPQHQVTLSGFWMGKYEVTQKQYEDIMEKNPSFFNVLLKGNHPVETVSWDDATTFCEKFSAKHGIKSRLPYEAEWEYACRAGSTTEYYWGSNIKDDYLWHGFNSKGKTHSVGGKLPNSWGLYDMNGNVAEWCMDWYDQDYYKVSPTINPKGPSSGVYRVVRGGSWENNLTIGVIDFIFRSSYRSHKYPEYKDNKSGFRLVITPGD